jgi:hypothetical protein
MSTLGYSGVSWKGKATVQARSRSSAVRPLLQPGEERDGASRPKGKPKLQSKFLDRVGDLPTYHREVRIRNALAPPRSVDQARTPNRAAL